MVKELLSVEDLNEVWEHSTEQPVLLFKQSTTCPISAAAFAQFNEFIKAHPDVTAYFVKVRETRPVSNQITDELGIVHESPQIFIVKDREALWNASHSQITKQSIQEAIKNFQ